MYANRGSCNGLRRTWRAPTQTGIFCRAAVARWKLSDLLGRQISSVDENEDIEPTANKLQADEGQNKQQHATNKFKRSVRPLLAKKTIAENRSIALLR
jgi:hypothetical protein